MTNRKFAAALTTQFMTRNPDLTVRSLKALVRLPLKRVIIVTDQKEADGRGLAEQAVEQTKEEFNRNGIEVEILTVDCYSTARRWLPGLCRAFEDKEIEAALNFLGDLKQDVLDQQIKMFIEAMETSEPNGLILFDYESNDMFKEEFDRMFLLPLLRIAHPTLMCQIEGLRHTKLRTELFFIGRKRFEHLRKNLGISWGTDPTVQILINSLNHDLSVRSLHVGSLGDDGNTRSDPSGQSLQITRIGHQILNDAIISSKFASGEQPTMATSEDLEQLSQDVHEEIQRCLRRNRMRAAAGNTKLNSVNRRIIIATHLVGGSAVNKNGIPSTLERIASSMQGILGDKLAKNLSLLVLMQPAASALFDQQEREIEAQRWAEEAERLNGLKKYPHVEVIFEMEFVPYEPATLAWRALQRRAFHSAQPADAMLYFDVNMIHWPDEHIRLFKPQFHRMLAELENGADYVLGDYHPVAPLNDPHKSQDVGVKQTIETVVKQMLEEAYPDLFRGWDLFRKLERPRTEFHGLSRGMYQLLGKKPHGPFDFGLFMLVIARLCGLKIERVMLGDLPETATNAPTKIVDQITRVKYEIDTMRHYRWMLRPANSKLEVSGLETKFAPFKGYSLLFSNPESTYEKREDGLFYVHCNGGSTPPFYQKLFLALQAIDLPQLRTGFAFCPLDPKSYHCTCLDGNNPENVNRVDADHHEQIQQFIHNLPGSMHDARTVLSEFYTARLACEEWSIEFVFDELAIWGGLAFVAKLKPADEAANRRLQELRTARVELAEKAGHWGLRPEGFSPHVSLGYFADPALGERAKIQLPLWTNSFKHQLGETRLAFRRVSLHAFTDMVTFFRLPYKD